MNKNKPVIRIGIKPPDGCFIDRQARSLESTIVSLKNLIELKLSGLTQYEFFDSYNHVILTIQEINNFTQLKYWKINSSLNEGTAYCELIIETKYLNIFKDENLFTLCQLNEKAIYNYFDIQIYDNFKYHELKRKYENGKLILEDNDGSNISF
jgi:hypothetical protein